MSTMPQPRYAIYFVPLPDTGLYRFGSSVLGYDSYTGEDVPVIAGADPAPWLDLVQEPRRYGFHATLKAPFHLASGLDESLLDREVCRLAADYPPVLVGEMAVRELGAFIALTPTAKRPLLDRLAEASVRLFDKFRAPMTAADRERRMAANLTPRQREHLEHWGYPYVFEDFRFHMTLTGPLAETERRRALAFLCEKFEQLPEARSLTLDQIVLARQADRSAAFQVIRQAALGRSPFRPYAYSY